MDREIQQRHPHLKKYVAVAIGVATAVAVVAWAVSRMTSDTYSTTTAGMTFGDVTEGEFRDYIRLNGRVETGTTVQVSALETGIVESRLAEEGAMVEAGDVIITLHNPTLRQQILDSESQLAEKQNMLRDTELAMEKERLEIKRQLLEARTELARKRRAMEQQDALYKESLTSREEYLQAREDYELARESFELLRDRLSQDSVYRAVQINMMRESLDNMRENFALVRSRADNLNIRASHAGQLGSLSAEIGQSISSGQQVGQINILDRYKITTQIDEHYIDRVEAGLKGSMERGGKVYEVSVAKVYPEVAEGKFRADMVIEGALPENIRVGQTYYLTLELGNASKAVMVPRGSYSQTTAGKWVFVVSEEGREATRREIRIGRQNPDFFEVKEGLRPGERIITSSYRDFTEADRLKIDDRD